MPAVALNGATIAQSTVSSHVSYNYQVYDSCKTTNSEGECVGGYWTYSGTTSANINGTCTATSNQVFINGKNAVLMGDRTVENDTYVPVSGGYNYRGMHTGAQGSVTSGNTKNVFIGGKPVSVLSSTVRTHAGTNTTINGGQSSNVFIGG